MNNTEKKILNSLLEKELITQEQFQEISNTAEEEDRSAEEIIQEKELLDPEKVTEVKAEVAEMPYENLVDQKAEQETLETIPAEVAENYQAVCFDKNEEEMKIGITDPYNSKAMEAINFLAQRENLKPRFFLISEQSFHNLYKQYKNLQEEVSSALEEKSKKEEEEGGEEEEEGGMRLAEEGAQELEEGGGGEDLESAPVAKIVSVIIRHAVEGGASDIHIEPMEKNTRVRYRIDGVLKTSLNLPKKVHDSIVGRIKVMAKLKIDETRIPQDGRIRLIVDKQRIDFRVSIMPMGGAEKVVMRILDLGKGVPELEELGYDSRALRIIKENIKKTYGLFLITGPTGSGKSTTLASMLSNLNKEDVNISTLEDPIEYYVKGVNQSQVKPSIDYTFANGLRALLRQDPDILMVGEIRDTETANLCIHAGLTGHFVLSTLHTNNSIDSIPRLLDMEVEPYLLGSTITTVIAQRLVRRICPKCKKKIKLPEEFKKNVTEEMKGVSQEMLKERVEGYQEGQDLTELDFYKGEGCAHCGGSGYKSRIAIVEIVDITKSLQKKIMKSSETLGVEDVKEDQDFINMKQDGIIKSLQGATTIEEVLRVVES